MQTIQTPIDYEGAIATLIRDLPTERAAQLYDFARFLQAESRSGVEFPFAENGDADLSEDDLVAEDVAWEKSLARHADRFAALKAQAKADVKAKKAVPMFGKHDEYDRLLG